MYAGSPNPILCSNVAVNIESGQTLGLGSSGHKTKSDLFVFSCINSREADRLDGAVWDSLT